MSKKKKTILSSKRPVNTNASIAKKVMNVMSHKNYLLKPDIDLVDMIAYFFFVSPPIMKAWVLTNDVCPG